MSGEKVTEYILLHPKGLAIINLIRHKGRKYITEISNELSVNRKVVSYHIRKLEKAGLVTTKLERTPRRRMKPTGEQIRTASPAPVLARYVYLTETGRAKFTLAPKILTDEDKTIMQTALDRGWFDSPRPDTGKLSALAEELGMSEASLSRKLRMISRQLSQGYLDRMTRRI